jgi:5'(3')-deoxyribonucleotidase
MKPRVLLDVDGPIADFTGYYLKLVHEVTGRTYIRAEVSQWDIAKALKLTRQEQDKVESWIDSPTSAMEIQEIPGAVHAVKKIAEMADVYFVTSPWKRCPEWTYYRSMWLRKRFGALGEKVIHTDQKHVCAGDMLVDDKLSNLEGWLNDRMSNQLAVLWDHPANKQIKLPIWIQRAYGWAKVEELVLQLAKESQS